MSDLEIRLQRRGRRARVRLHWEMSPFFCDFALEGDEEVLEIYAQELTALSGYYVRGASVFNVEAHLNAIYAAKLLFPDLQSEVVPSFDLSQHLDPEDLDPSVVY